MADIKEVLQRKYGPLYVWQWTGLVAVFIAAFIFLKQRAAGKSGPTASTVNPQGEFSSGQSSTTTDANGNQTTTNYSASGPLTGFPGYITNQAGPMPYSGGDVYVNYPNTPGAPPPAQTTDTNPNANRRTVLNATKFNEVGWSDKDKQSPWAMAVAQPGETWQDITARIYSFAKDYASIKDPAAKSRVDQVAAYLKSTNSKYTGEVPDGTGPTPGSVVVYR